MQEGTILFSDTAQSFNFFLLILIEPILIEISALQSST